MLPMRGLRIQVDSLKTYYNNQFSADDKEVYCSQHVPKIGAGRIDKDSVEIKAALNVPKVSIGINEQIRPGGKSSFDAEALAIKSHIVNRTAGQDGEGRRVSENNGYHDEIDERKKNWGRFDSSALHIQHALKQTAVQKKYNKPHAHAIESFLVSYCLFVYLMKKLFLRLLIIRTRRSRGNWSSTRRKRRTGCTESSIR